VQVRTPAVPPPTRIQNGACVVISGGIPDPLLHRETRGLTVRPDPRRATIAWLPGLNSKTCQAMLTVLSGSAAAALAAAVDQSPVVTRTGVTNCPFGDGTAAELYFAYRRSPTVVVDVALNGCTGISASDGRGRELDAAVQGDLFAAAPAAWQGYLGPTR
jgi:hypothetical protein